MEETEKGCAEGVCDSCGGAGDLDGGDVCIVQVSNSWGGGNRESGGAILWSQWVDGCVGGVGVGGWGWGWGRGYLMWKGGPGLGF